MKLNVQINRKVVSYPIIIGNENFCKLAKKIVPDNKFIIFTDNGTYKALSGFISKTKKDLKAEIIEIKSGEASKNLKTAEKIYSQLLELKAGRDSCLITIGGGVVGDLGGFIASTYLRGIPLIHVPTTLLAMVDSSIGGKTGLDNEFGKNLIGSTFHPKLIYMNPELLKTLPQEELVNGMAEVIKTAAIKDEKLFSFIEKNIGKILEKDKESLERVITDSVKIKKEVIENDEKESHERMILNFGHTIGHSIEKYHLYNLSHGKSISIGMAVECNIAELKGTLSKTDSQKLKNLLKKTGLPVKFSDPADKIILGTSSDKKNRKGKSRYVLLEKIGKTYSKASDYAFEIDEDIIRKALENARN